MITARNKCVTGPTEQSKFDIFIQTGFIFGFKVQNADDE